ncbi:hypothetical protein SDRG_07788 [Saprolegnia diclina VS20]|uniref:RecA family profile 1 domain-containing protein n=1 Tax=Saprolegnia diclina (strain VS20) TaxID=1156394 RepID=T0RPS0_SAPDV|nr:hypothetical protein SDRG_07788 [Saprolegnia diclina VS20]EQC34458.1 hypothetical protein SDRG_07788 [Saprolegnia diclina VS20]|eukprot:XP_008611864.1 hypothetical protein SDRG_07788 [Saprolegnia diclina VS20]
MLRHVLAQEGVAATALEAKGIRSFKRLVQVSEMEAAQILDVSTTELEHLVARIALRSCPKPTLAFDMFMNSVNSPSSLRTTLAELDKGMYGGLPCGAITELAGVSGIGKSQFCMQLAVLCAIEYPDTTILYFNSGQNVSAKRICEMARARLSPMAYTTEAALCAKVAAIAQHIRLVPVSTLDELQTHLDGLAADLTGSCKMLLVDSLASLAQESGLEMSLAKRQMLLMNVASNLKYLAAAYEAFVVVTNHATTKHHDGAPAYSHPALGVAWAHSITIRIILERTTSFSRTLTILKSSMSPHISFPFEIQRQGLVMHPATRNEDGDEDEDAFDEDMLSWADLPVVDDHGTLLASQSQRSLGDEDEDEDEDEDRDMKPCETAPASNAASTQAPNASVMDTMFDIVPDSDEDGDAWASVPGW